MNTIRTDEGGRRTFVKNGCIAVGLICFAAGMRGADSQTSASAEDHPATHNMLVVGHDTIFLSHLPMFQGVNATKAAFTSPHRYQGYRIFVSISRRNFSSHPARLSLARMEALELG